LTEADGFDIDVGQGSQQESKRMTLMDKQSTAHPQQERSKAPPAAREDQGDFTGSELAAALEWMGAMKPYNIRITRALDRLLRPAGNKKGDIAKHILAAILNPECQGKLRPIAFGPKTASTTARLPIKVMERISLEAATHRVSVCDQICSYIAALHGKLDNPAYNGSKPGKAKPGTRASERSGVPEASKDSKLGSHPH
jgi:hypothetical protein